MRLTQRIRAPFGGRPEPAARVGSGPPAVPAPPVAAEPAAPSPNLSDAGPQPGASTPGADIPDMTAGTLVADPCGPARSAVDDACSLADRMAALATASLDRLREARHAYEEHAARRERAAAQADPRAVRAGKDAAQAVFRRARLEAAERGSLEAAAREWLGEIDRINVQTREAVRILAREDALEASLLHAVERLGVEADGARIAAESAAETCHNARITLATCEEREQLSASNAAGQARGLAAASIVASASPAAPAPDPMAAAPAPSGTAPPQPPTAAAPAPSGTAARAGTLDARGAEAAGAGAEDAFTDRIPAVLPLLAGDRAIQRRIARELAAGDAAAEVRWQAQLAALVDAITQRAIDSAALVFPEEDPFWGPYTQLQCREIAAALAALGFRFDGHGAFTDERTPGQRQLSLAIGYAGLDPMRIRIWPTEAELPGLFANVEVDTGRFVTEAAGDLTLGEMIDLLGRRAEELSDLWNAWGRVRPLLLAPA